MQAAIARRAAFVLPAQDVNVRQMEQRLLVWNCQHVSAVPVMLGNASYHA
jgi:hypothetical protein